MAEAPDTNNGFSIFGYTIQKKKPEDKNLKSVVPPTDDDGAGYITAAGHHYGHYIDLDGTSDIKDNIQTIKKYRSMSYHPDVDMAIGEIVNEAIVTGEEDTIVSLNLDKTKLNDSIKKKITAEFEKIYGMLNFNDLGHDIFRSWYVDGRIYHHLLIDESKPRDGIKEIRYIDAIKIRKVKNVKKKKDPATGVSFVEKVDEFYIFQEKPNATASTIKLSPDTISYVTSGLLDENKRRVVSYLHKAIKPTNQLSMMEDSLVIYRLARAPERRIFYIDVGTLPTKKAQTYMENIKAKYRNKLTYDASTGNLRDDRKHMSMLEDFWLPRKEGGRGTEISTLPGGDNLGQIDDIVYFQKKLFRALNVPINRLEQEAQFSLGRSSEITRDEVKFQKFVDKLRNRFGKIFLNILKKQLILTNIMTEEDWEEHKNDIFVEYQRDNYFSELKDSEIQRERLQSLDMIEPHVGKYYSREWVMKNILKLDDDDIKNMKKEIDDEIDDEPDPNLGMLDAPMEPEQAQQQPAGAEPKQQQKPKQKPQQPKEDFALEAELNLMEELTNFIKQ